ncbi:MAG: hypothetical protein HYS08_06535 [Chlamydiae bacterium]|nr:hypothetical protein [Chlamydiota bacterium]MBI3265581.1 hypothetical protein [Chlamydiota bacterium]
MKVLEFHGIDHLETDSISKANLFPIISQLDILRQKGHRLIHKAGFILGQDFVCVKRGSKLEIKNISGLKVCRKAHLLEAFRAFIKADRVEPGFQATPDEFLLYLAQKSWPLRASLSLVQDELCGLWKIALLERSRIRDACEYQYTLPEWLRDMVILLPPEQFEGRWDSHHPNVLRSRSSIQIGRLGIQKQKVMVMETWMDLIHTVGISSSVLSFQNQGDAPPLFHYQGQEVMRQAISQSLGSPLAVRRSTASLNVGYWQAREEKPRSYFDPELREHLRKEVDSLLPTQGTLLDIASGSAPVCSRENRVVKGVGLVEKSMRANKILSEFKVHDFNQDPNIPYRERFDAAVISFAVMYFTYPIELLCSIRQHLKGGGRLVMIFSELFFDASVSVNAWNFPRVYGFRNRCEVILNYFERAGGFGKVHQRTVNDHFFIFFADAQPEMI